MQKKIIAAITILMLVLLAMPVMPRTEAAQLTSVKDTISDSSPSATATHTFDFTTATEVPGTGDITVTFADGFDLSNVATSDVTCPGSATVSTSTHTVTCTYSTALATGTQELIVANVVNPSGEQSYLQTITTHDGSSNQLDSGEARVAIISNISVTAHVPALLTFSIAGVNASTTVEGGVTNATSATSTITFGTVNNGVQYIAAQKLSVQTNANDGFSVKVWQDHDLKNAMNNNINKFVDGATGSPQAWVAPSASTTDPDTYGHFGLRSDDDSVSLNFGTSSWVGFYGDGTNYQQEVFSNPGPASGNSDSQHVGWDYVEYSLEISALQEAGDYSNTLTYICTPTY